MEMNESEIDLDNTFKILLATDIHLGYMEKDEIRGDDTYQTFEEILQIAVKEEVDFILLGGDLFHDCRPSTHCVHKCTELIRRYCLGDKPISIEFLSDQAEHFKHLMNPIVNYEDQNINISTPVFTIHGNHDDPAGRNSKSTLDVLAATGLVNYFGRWTDLSNVEISPLLLQKGESKIALYGLSHIHDARLARLFRDKKVTMLKPSGTWFNLFVLHQNRAFRGNNNFIQTSSIPEFVDLVFWGHEHDCLIEPVNINNSTWITQPGSSVATSLCEGEAKKKHVGVLYVQSDQTFHIRPVPLETVRPFIFKTITLDSLEQLRDNCVTEFSHHASKVAIKEIERILEEVDLERIRKNLPKVLPLVRLIVKYHDEEQNFNKIRVSQNFHGKVANPEDVILQKPLNTTKEKRSKFNAGDFETESKVEELSKIQDLFKMELEKETNQIDVLSVNGLCEAISRYIEVDDSEAIDFMINHQIDQTIKQLIEMDVKENEICEAKYLLHQKRKESSEEDKRREAANVLDDTNRQQKQFTRTDDTMMTLSDDDDEVSISTPNKTVEERPKRGRGSRGPRSGRARGSRAKKN